MPDPDVFIPYREGRSSGEELRYALRSICAHVPHRTIWLIGDAPDWYTGKHIATERVSGPYRDQTAAWAAYAAHRSTRRDAVLWYDDLFAMEPVTPTLLAGLRLAEHRFIGRDGGYDGKRTETAAKYPGALDLDGHWPMPLTKDGIKALLPVLDTDADNAFKRTVYGVVNGTDGARLDTPDCKVGKAASTATLDQITGPYLSTNDDTFVNGAAGQRVREMFQTPCRWEK